MKPVLKKLTITIIYTSILFIIVLIGPKEQTEDYKDYITDTVSYNFVDTYDEVNNFNVKKDEEEKRKVLVVYNDMTMDELSNKINKSLNSTISNKGNLIASYSLKRGVDPIIATAIILQETGCKWDCSYLVKACNNVGGVKGGPGCNGEYKRYSSLDNGIKHFIDNLADNFYAYGLNTPEKMNSKYAESKSWAQYVNNYINEINNK